MDNIYSFTNVSKKSLSLLSLEAKKLMIKKTKSSCQLSLIQKLYSLKVGTSKIEKLLDKLTSKASTQRVEGESKGNTC